jgi:hypothetical protein
MADMGEIGLAINDKGAVVTLKAIGKATDELSDAEKRQNAVLRQLAQANLEIQNQRQAEQTALRGLNKEQRDQARIVIEAQGGMQRYAQALREVEQAQKKTADATKTVAASFVAAYTSGMTWTNFLKTNMGPAMTQLGGHVPAIKELGAQWRGFTASTGPAGDGLNRLTGSATSSHLATSRLTHSFESLASQLTGVHPIIGRVLVALTNLGVGSAVTLGVVAAAAAIAFAYRKLTEDTRKLAEETDKAIDRLRQLKIQQQGSTFGITTDIGLADARVADARRRLGIAQSFTGGEANPSGDPGFGPTPAQIAKQKKAISDLNAEIAAGIRERNSIIEEGAKKTQGTMTTDLANLVKHNQATAQQRAAALALLRAYQADFDRLGKHDVAGRSALLGLSDPLQEALFPKLKKDATEAEEATRRLKEEIEKLKLSFSLQPDFGFDLGLAIEAMARKLGPFGNIQPENTVERDMRDAALKAEQARRAEAAQVQQWKKEQAARDVQAAEKYQADMRAIWRAGIGRIVTDGTKSFRDFFDDVLRMFTSLMARMEQEGKTGGGMYKALGIGSAAIAGGFGGYQIGQQVGNPATGALGGAASGAAAGSFAGPWGAVIGGLTGFVGGLLGGASAAHEAAVRFKELQKAAADTIASFHALATGTQGSLAEQIRQAHKDADEARKAAAINPAAAGGTTDGLTGFSAWLRLHRTAIDNINADEAAYIELLKKEDAIKKQQFKEDLQVRLLRAHGQDSEANALAKRLADQREYDAAVKAGADAATLALLKTVQTAEELKAASDALSTSLRNPPSGFKIESYINRFAAPRPWTYPGPPLDIPYRPQGGPTTTGGNGGTRVDMRGATITLSLPKGMKPEEVGPAFMRFLDKVASTTIGGNAPISEALDYAPRS